MTVRAPAVAGAFYPAGPADLRSVVAQFSNQPAPDIPRRLKALVVPHAGYVYSGAVAGLAGGLLKRHADTVRRVLLIGPAHGGGVTGAAVDGHDAWHTPLGDVAVEVPAGLTDRPTLSADSRPHLREHCLEVVLPFLQVALRDFTITPVVTGNVDPAALATDLDGLLDAWDLLIVSTDLSHYLPADTAENIDRSTLDTLLNLDTTALAVSGEACGLVALLTLLHLARSHGWMPHLLGYRHSGEVSGDMSGVVGYAAVVFTV